MSLLWTTSDLSEFFDVHERTIRAWSKKGMPKIGHGKWDPKAVHRWWLENIYGDSKSADEADSGIREHKTRYWKAKAVREEIRAEVDRGALIPRKAVIASWTWRIAEVKKGLTALKDRLAGRLAAKTRDEAYQILDEEIHDMLGNYSRDGQFTPQLKNRS